ncbi:MAG: AIM24 family protein, partial [Thermoanaerobaculales bacterium]|nr:AIM24 family protein [Thermoanaerobaculales bacterium]
MSDAMWYVAVDGQTVGPMSEAELVDALQAGTYAPNTQVYCEGVTDWAPANTVADLASHAPPPPPPTQRRGGQADQVDFDIHGEEMQFVEVELDPGESVVAEAGSMMYMGEGIEMETTFGDGSAQQSTMMDKLVGAGKRLLTGESLFMTIFTHKGSGKSRAAFASPYPGKIIPVDLGLHGGALICQKDAFLCAAKGVSISIAFQKRIGTALFGGEGFIMQKLEGDGLAFVHAGGTIIERELGAGQKLRVDTGCLVALETSVTYDIEFVGGVKS